MSKTMLFNPYSGRPRDPRDIQSDPEGILMLDPDEPIRAAHPEPSEETVSALRDCLSQIDMAACYASEEDTKSVADALLMIGMQARKALALLAASTELVAPAAQAEK